MKSTFFRPPFKNSQLPISSASQVSSFQLRSPSHYKFLHTAGPCEKPRRSTSLDAASEGRSLSPPKLPSNHPQIERPNLFLTLTSDWRRRGRSSRPAFTGHMFPQMPHTVSLRALGAFVANDHWVAPSSGRIFCGDSVPLLRWLPVGRSRGGIIPSRNRSLLPALIAAWLVAGAVARNGYWKHVILFRFCR